MQFEIKNLNHRADRIYAFQGILLFFAVLNPPFLFGFPSLDFFIFRVFEDKHFVTPLDEPAIPLVGIIVLLLGILSWKKIIKLTIDLRPEAVIPVSIGVFFFALGLIAFMRSGEVYSILGAIQYSAVPLSYLVGRSLYCRLDLFNLVAASFLLYTTFLAIVLLYVYGQYDLSWFESLHRVRMAIPGLFVYIPAYLICLVYLCIGFAKGKRDNYIAIVCTSLLALVMLVNWSRASIIIGVLTPCLAIAGILLLRLKTSAGRGIQRPHQPVAILLVAALTITLIIPNFGLIGSREQIETSEQIETREQIESLSTDDEAVEYVDSMEKSNLSRWQFFLTGLDMWEKKPIFGVMFKPQAYNYSEGRLIPRKRVFQSHNQYLDILLKSGIVGLFAFACFLVSCIFLPLKTILREKLARNENHAGIIIFSSLLAAIVLAANFQLYLTVWTTGIPIMFLTGYLISLWSDREAGD